MANTHSTLRVFFLFKDGMVAHCVDGPRFACPLTWWTLGLLPLFSYCEQCCCEHGGVNIFQDPVFSSFGCVSGINGSRGNSTFNFLRNLRTVFQPLPHIILPPTLNEGSDRPHPQTAPVLLPFLTSAILGSVRFAPLTTGVAVTGQQCGRCPPALALGDPSSCRLSARVSSPARLLWRWAQWPVASLAWTINSHDLGPCPAPPHPGSCRALGLAWPFPFTAQPAGAPVVCAEDCPGPSASSAPERRAASGWLHPARP